MKLLVGEVSARYFLRDLFVSLPLRDVGWTIVVGDFCEALLPLHLNH